MTSITSLVLVGLPNTGKTTLFNHLTGTRYKIGNWSGVTIKAHKAIFEVSGKRYALLDVPGVLSVYDLVDQTDCQVCRQAIEKADVLINVIDARYLHRDLVLTLQLLCYEKPFLTVVTHEDKSTLGRDKLSQVLPAKTLFASEISLEDILSEGQKAKTVSLDILEWPIGFSVPKGHGALVNRLQQCLLQDPNSDIQIAEGFYQTAAVLIDRYGCRESVDIVDNPWDAWVLHPVYGILIFLGVVYSMFSVTIGLGGAFGDLLAGLVLWGSDWLPKGHLIWIVLRSLGTGVATCIGFLPILGVMYTCMGYLEQSGYLSRIVLLSDGLMRPIGLSGHSFLPLILGFGCNIPAVMATRVISGERNRILTALMIPFMSCSARLAIFAIFTAAFFPYYGALVIMGLYLLSVGLGILTVLMLQYVFQFQGNGGLSVTLPSYQWPEFSQVIYSVLLKLKGFLKENMGKIVVFASLLGLMGQVNLYAEMVSMDQSILARLGVWLSQYLGFMGISGDNWPASVALLAGIVAKEVVIVTLNSLYQVSQDLPTLLDIFSEFSQRVLYFPLQFFLLDSGEIGIHTLYQAHFSMREALSYMVFVLLYFPCLSTMVVLKQEFNLGVAGFSFIWSTVLAIWFSKMVYWGMGWIDLLYFMGICVIMRLVRYYYDTLKS